MMPCLYRSSSFSIQPVQIISAICMSGVHVVSCCYVIFCRGDNKEITYLYINFFCIFPCVKMDTNMKTYVEINDIYVIQI